jgi:hypothetical protein
MDDLGRLLFGDWRSAREAHIVNAIHLALVLAGLAYARLVEGMSGPTFDFIALSAIGTVVVFGIGRLARTRSEPSG